MNTIGMVLTTVVLCGLTADTCRAFYNPEKGRWPNRDPIGELGGLNLYGFVNNDAVAQIDTRGDKTIKIGGPSTVVKWALNLYSSLLTQLVDLQHVRWKTVIDVECPPGSRRLLVEDFELKEQKILGVWAYASEELLRPFIDYGLEVRKPLKHIIVKRYACCRSCWSGRRPRISPMRTVVDYDQIEPDDDEFWSVDDGSLIIEVGFKKRHLEKRRERECEKVDPIKETTTTTGPVPLQ